MKVEGYGEIDKDGKILSDSAIPENHPQKELLTEGLVKIWEYETKEKKDELEAWYEAMEEWNKFRGYEPYQRPNYETIKETK